MDIKIMILAALAHISVSMPVTGSLLQYPPAKIFRYHYTTDTRLNEAGHPGITQAKKDVGFRFTGVCDVMTVWGNNHEQLMKLTISEPKLHSIARDDVMKDLRGLPRLPVYFRWSEGRVSQVYAAEDDSTLAVNIKKGVISLFQLQLEDGERSEVDTSGECKATYTKSGSSLVKVKSECSSLEIGGQYRNTNEIFDVNMTPHSETQIEIHDDVIKGVLAKESYTSSVNVQNTISTSVQAMQDMRLESTHMGKSESGSTIDDVVHKISSANGYKLYQISLVSIFGGKQQCAGQCPSTTDIVNELRGHLTSDAMATKNASHAFLTLVAAFRTSPKDTILGILHNKDNDEIVPQLIDAATAAQTSSCQEALMEFLHFDSEDDIQLQERYLLSVALSSTHPSEQLLADLLSLFDKNVPNENLRESVGEALGAVLYTYCQNGEQCSQQIVQTIQSRFIEKLEKCEEENCKAHMLRALCNAGLRETLPIILQMAEKSTDPVISEEAIKALRRINIDEAKRQEVKDVMTRIFLQKNRGFDTSVRSKALKIVLESNPSEEELKEILLQSTDPWNSEYNMFIQARLFNLMAQYDQVEKMVKSHLKSSNVSNYHILAPKGKSLAFTNPMAETSGTSSDYFIYVENGRSGIIKRSGMDVNVYGMTQTLSMFSLGIFAAGLENLLGEEVEPGQEDAAATAGLALDLVGVSLRPITFFTGQSGLMSAVWNAPVDPISALQANILLQDHLERIHLQNGLIVELEVQGCVSMDLSGSVTISLWNKNSKSLIKNSGTLLIQGSSRIVTSSFRTAVEFSVDSSSAIDFQSDVDFYDGIKTCLQMGRPDSVLRHKVKKYEHARGFQNAYISRIERSRHIPAVSYPLPKPNAKQCRVLLAET